MLCFALNTDCDQILNPVTNGKCSPVTSMMDICDKGHSSQCGCSSAVLPNRHWLESTGKQVA